MSIEAAPSALSRALCIGGEFHPDAANVHQNAVGNPNAMFQRATTWDDWIWCQSWQRSVCQGAVAIRQLQKQNDQGVITSSYKFRKSLERQAVAA